MWLFQKRKMVLCDGCRKKMKNKEGYLFYSEYSAVPEIMSNIGLLLLCQSCTNLIVNAWTGGKFDKLPPFDGNAKGVSDFNKNTTNGIISKCKHHGLAPEEAKKKAHELALELWESRVRGEKESLDFWKSKQ